MSGFDREEITARLRRWNSNNPDQWDVLLPDVYDELRACARRVLGRHHDVTLDPTALVHELYLKFRKPPQVDWKDRHHFVAIAALAMRQILVEEARKKRSKKRSAERVSLTGAVAELGSTGIRDPDLVDLDQALIELEKVDPAACRIIELRFFGGLTKSETAQVLGVSERTVYNKFTWARTWVSSRLNPLEEPDPK